MNRHLTYEDFYDTYQTYDLIYKNYFEQTKEIDRLNNIINELEKGLINIKTYIEIEFYKEYKDKYKLSELNLQNCTWEKSLIVLHQILELENKLKELKEENK